MRAKYWLAGCILCIAGTGTAAATNRAVHDMDGTTPPATDNSTTHDDAVVDTAAAEHNGAPRDTESGDHAADRFPGHLEESDSAPTVHQRHLGWQSLLPGSIQ
jgi:hypothetical protein